VPEAGPNPRSSNGRPILELWLGVERCSGEERAGDSSVMDMR
jgi:hypothetical protein